MADFDNSLSLEDALTETPPEIEEEIKRDFMSTLEAEAFDDVVGETVSKTDYIPLLDDDDKTGNPESKSKPLLDGGQVQCTTPTKPTVLANGDHELEENDTRDPYQMYQDNNLSDLLFVSPGMANTSPFAEHLDSSKDNIGDMPSCDSYISRTETGAREWPVESQTPSDSSPFLFLDSNPQLLQPMTEPIKEVETEMELSKEVSAMKDVEMTLAPTLEVEKPLMKEVEPVKVVESEPVREVALDKEVKDKPVREVTPGRGTQVEQTTEIITTQVTQEVPSIDIELMEEMPMIPAKESQVVPAVEVVKMPAVEVEPTKEALVAEAMELTLPKEIEVVTPAKDMKAQKMSEAPGLASPQAEESPETLMASLEFPKLPGMDSLQPLQEEILQEVVSPHTEPKIDSRVADTNNFEQAAPVSVAEVNPFKSCPENSTALPIEVPCVPSDPVEDLEQKVYLPETSVPAEDKALEKLEEIKALVSSPETILETLNATPLVETKTSLVEETPPSVDFTELEKPKGEIEQCLISSAEPLLDPTGAPTAQVKQAYKPSDHRFGAPKPVSLTDVPSELLGGHSHQKIPDQRLESFFWSESGWTSSSSPRSRFPQRRTPHADFMESRRDLGRETWDVECTPASLKKKKKKSKQKRYLQPRGGEPWDENTEISKTHVTGGDSTKADITQEQSASTTKEFGPMSKESSRKGAHSREGKLMTASSTLEALSSSPGPTQKANKMECHSPVVCSTDRGEKVSKVKEIQNDGLISQNRSPVNKGILHVESKPQPSKGTDSPSVPIVSQFKPTLDNIQGKGVPDLELPCPDVAPKKQVEAPFETRLEEGGFINMNQEVRDVVSKHVTQQEQIKFSAVDTDVLANSLKDIDGEGKAADHCTNLLKKKMELNELCEGDRIKINEKKTSEQSQEKGFIASEQPWHRVAGPKSQKGLQRSEKTGDKKGRKIRASIDMPILETQKDGENVGANGKTPQMKGISVHDKHKGLESVPSSLVLEPMASVFKTLTEVPKEKVDPIREVKITSKVSSPLDDKIGTGQTLAIVVEKHSAKGPEKCIAEPSDKSLCPVSESIWLGPPEPSAALQISDKPKKRGCDGKNKKFKKSCSEQPVVMENKSDAHVLPFADKNGNQDKQINFSDKKELALLPSKILDPLLLEASDKPEKWSVGEKDRVMEISSSEPQTFAKNTKPTKDSTSAVSDANRTDASYSELIFPTQPLSSGQLLEGKTEVSVGEVVVADKPKKRSIDGKSKKNKNSQTLIETKPGTIRVQIPMETKAEFKVEGMSCVDENKNITYCCSEPPTIQASDKDTLKTTPLSESEVCGKPCSLVFSHAEMSDSLPNALAESEKETSKTHVSKLLSLNDPRKYPVVGDERTCSLGKGPPVNSLTSITVVPDVRVATETKSQDKFNLPGHISSLQNKALKDGGHVTVEKNEKVKESSFRGSVEDNTTKQPEEKMKEPGKEQIHLHMPVEDASLVLENKSMIDHPDQTIFPVFKEKEKTLVTDAVLQGKKGEKLNFLEDKHSQGLDSKDLVSSNGKVDVTIPPSKQEETQIEKLSLGCKNIDQEEGKGSLLEHSDLSAGVSDSKEETTPLEVVVDDLSPAPIKSIESSKSKDTILEASQKIIEKSGQRALGGGKTEARNKVIEPLKGYMRPTKSRGLNPPLLRPAVLDLEKTKHLKSHGMNQLKLENGVCLWFEAASTLQIACMLILYLFQLNVLLC